MTIPFTNESQSLFFPKDWRRHMADPHCMISTEDVECALKFLMLVKQKPGVIIKMCNWIDIYLIPRRHRALNKLRTKLSEVDYRERFLLFPICENLHFSLIAIDFAQRRLYCADSLLNFHNNEKRLESVLWFIQEEEATEWSIHQCSKILQKGSTTSCGPMICLFAINIVQRLPLETCLTDHHAHLLREFLVEETDLLFRLNCKPIIN